VSQRSCPTFGDEAAAYNTVGYICLLNQRYPQAEDFFTRAISTSPVYYRLATENLEETRRRALP
jgi:uncharacterized protein HemY